MSFVEFSYLLLQAASFCHVLKISFIKKKKDLQK